MSIPSQTNVEWMEAPTLLEMLATVSETLWNYVPPIITLSRKDGHFSSIYFLLSIFILEKIIKCLNKVLNERWGILSMK